MKSGDNQVAKPTTKTDDRLPKLTIQTESSVIASIEYDPAREVVTVYFVNGHIHDYEYVHPVLVAEWIKAPSAGVFFNRYIRPLSP